VKGGEFRPTISAFYALLGNGDLNFNTQPIADYTAVSTPGSVALLIPG